jgi:hypothetical protein
MLANRGTTMFILFMVRCFGKESVQVISELGIMWRKWSWLSLSILEGLKNTIRKVVLVTQCYEGVEVQLHVS